MQRIAQRRVFARRLVPMRESSPAIPYGPLAASFPAGYDLRETDREGRNPVAADG